MADTRLDRASLRRQVQRTESYTSLVSKRKINLKNSNIAFKKSKTERCSKKSENILENNNKENEVEGNSNDNVLHVSSPPSTLHGASSDSSQEYEPGPDQLQTLKAMHCSLFQTELEVTSVMTRSATRKYASVGAIHNKVNIEHELKMVKKWPRHISYQTPDAPGNHSLLKLLVTKSLDEVLSLCKQMALVKCELLLKPQDEVNSWQLDGESAGFIDLSPYLTEEPVIVNGKDETQITFHLNDSFLPHQFISIISLNEEEHDGTLVIQEDNEDYETITLHSGGTYFLDNKYFNDVNSTYCTNTFPEDPMMAVYNDHTYALKYAEKTCVAQQRKQSTVLDTDKESEFKLENALDSLLLNTAILKCLICGETPQDMISFLETAQTN